jgi:predicted O-methyltransferase YrrM
MRRCATTLEGEMTTEEHRFLVELLSSGKRRGTHLEIGTGAGGTLCVMLNAFAQENRPRFVVIDTMRYFPGQLESVLKNLARHGFDQKAVDIRVSKSDAAFARAETANERFEFVLIDGSHKVRAVMGDLRWSRLVNVGGIICLHDYSPRFLGVQMAVNHFLRRNRNYRRIALAGSLLVLRKEALAARREVTRVDELYASALHLLMKLKTN